PAAGDQGYADDRQVDQEDRAPAEVREQPAARDRADRHTEAADRGPQTDRLRALAVVGEYRAEDRQRGRHDERAADAHDHAGGDQLGGRGGERGGQGAGREDD